QALANGGRAFGRQPAVQLGDFLYQTGAAYLAGDSGSLRGEESHRQRQRRLGYADREKVNVQQVNGVREGADHGAGLQRRDSLFNAKWIAAKIPHDASSRCQFTDHWDLPRIRFNRAATSIGLNGLVM